MYFVLRVQTNVKSCADLSAGSTIPNEGSECETSQVAGNSHNRV